MDRLPVPARSRRRRRAGWVALILFSLPYALHHYFTRDAYIRRQAKQFLEAATDGRVEIESAHFSLFSGIRLSGVRILTPPDATMAPPFDRSRVIFSAGSLELRHEPLPLLWGKLHVRSLTASAPRFTLLYDADTDRYNWDLLFTGQRTETGPTEAPPRARIRLRSAEVELHRYEQGRLHKVAPYRLDADAWPQPESMTAYDVDYRIYVETPQRIRG
ncbi:MAG: hypothetical protein V3T70_00940, partial [Phycisphaerae bacterium]